ncbi:DUF3329 domain-containing protein [Companilactobacillus sp.]|uniref:DUF3329 domain-containing protein n=1 Tax=Companilactobacillus sp. TaxID=2767905 RepID=UPI0025C04919|nr:DUF6056 family protein [Companilactobacillus sp.]
MATSIFLIFVFAIMMVLNLRTLYTADDYVYRFFYDGASPLLGQHVVNTWTIPHSMYNHYLQWNGRFVAHTVVQFFMQFNSKLVFDIFNSLAFIALMLLISKTVSLITQVKTKTWMLVGIFGFLWFAIPSFGQTVLWVSGSGNYLWMSLIYLGSVYLCLKDEKVTVLNLILAAIVGFLAGATNENSGPATMVVIFLFVVVKFFQDKKINWYAIVNLIFAFIGFVTMMLSPGSQLRAKQTPHNYTMATITICQQVVHLYKWFYLFFMILLIIGLIWKKLDWNRIFAIVIFLIGHVLTIFVMIASPEYPERTFFGGTVFFAVAFFILVYSVCENLKLAYNVPLAVVILLFFSFSYRGAYSDINRTYLQVQGQYQTFEKAKSNHKQVVKVPLISVPTTTYNAYLGTLQLDFKPNSWMNMWEAKFFGIKDITGYYVDRTH